MSVRSFRSVFMVGGVAGAALSCYLVSLRVASERAALEDAETEIVLAQRDIRLLQTEIGTRGRLAQLERWNVKVLALSAPSADQFVADGFTLARLTQPESTPAVEAPVVYASAQSAPEPNVLKQEEGVRPAPRLMHEASLSIVRAAPKLAPRKLTVTLPDELADAVKATPAPTPAKKAPASAKADLKGQPAVAKAKVSPSPDKPKPAEVKVAKADPLAPVPKPKKVTAPAKKMAAAATAKDSSKTR